MRRSPELDMRCRTCCSTVDASQSWSPLVLCGIPLRGKYRTTTVSKDGKSSELDGDQIDILGVSSLGQTGPKTTN